MVAVRKDVLMKLGNVERLGEERLQLLRAIDQDRIMPQLGMFFRHSCRGYRILCRARERHIPVLCNIHDVELACAFCTKIIGLQDGVKKFEGPPDKLDKAALQEIYAMEVL